MPARAIPRRRTSSCTNAHRSRCGALLLGGAIAIALATVTSLTEARAEGTPPVTFDGRSAYVPVTPCRLADTRVASASPAIVGANTLRVNLVGHCDVPSGTSAVALSIAVTDTTRSGFADVTSAGRRGNTSTLNWTAGETRSASTIAVPSADGTVDVYVSVGVSAVSVVVDVTGRWQPVSGAVSSGRVRTVDANRVLDTRTSNQRLAAGQSITLDRSTLGVPADAVGVTGNLTATGGSGAGYLTAFPAGRTVPLASNVNTDGADQDRASGIIVPLGDRGLTIFAGGFDTDVVFDVTGYISGPSESPSIDGLLLPADRVRILDTRVSLGHTTTATTVHVPAPGDVSIGGIFGSITATDASRAGFAAIHAGDTATVAAGDTRNQRQTSNVNWSDGGAVASMVIQHVGPSGQIEVSASTPAALILDVTAYLLTDPTAVLVPFNPVPVEPTQPVPATTVPPVPSGDITPHVIATGDIVDLTGDGNPTGDPLDLLRETFTSNELAAGGGVNIVYTQPPGGAQMMVPYYAASFPACGSQPMCIMINKPYWTDPGADPVNSNRVMISHEFGHVLAARYQTYMAPVDYFAWIKVYAKVNEECVADDIATIVLARGGFKPNETADYIHHYSCDAWWVQEYGADHLAEVKAQCLDLANDLLVWAEQWGAAHPKKIA